MAMKQIKIGTATLIHGDCEEFMKDLPDKCFDLAVVDPPYGIGAGGEGFKNGSSKSEKSYFKKICWDSSRPEKSYFNELIRASNN